jgi:hypothetical protein
VRKQGQYTLAVSTEFDAYNPPTIKEVRRRLAKMARAVPEGATVSIVDAQPKGISIPMWPEPDRPKVLIAKWTYDE